MIYLLTSIPLLKENLIIAEELFGSIAEGSASLRLQELPFAKAAISLQRACLIINLSGEGELKLDPPMGSHLMIGKVRSDQKHSSIISLEEKIDSTLASFKGRGTISVIFSDNHFGGLKYRSKLYKRILNNADRVVSPNSFLLKLANIYSPNSDKYLIPDVCQISKKTFQPICGKVFKIIWFGQGRNVAFLLQSISNLIMVDTPGMTFELSILTNEFYFEKIKLALWSIFNKSNRKHIVSRWEFRLVPWNMSRQPHQLEEELHRADISFIPSDPDDDVKKYVSTNRLVDSLRSGCVCISAELPSYAEFADVSFQGSDYASNLKSVVKDYPEICDEFNSRLSNRLNNYSESSILKMWQQLVVL